VAAKKKPAKLRPDMNELAYRTMLAATGQGPKPAPPGDGEKNPEAVKRGREGGKKGGKARATALRESDLAEIARRCPPRSHLRERRWND